MLLMSSLACTRQSFLHQDGASSPGGTLGLRCTQTKLWVCFLSSSEVVLKFLNIIKLYTANKCTDATSRKSLHRLLYFCAKLMESDF